MSEIEDHWQETLKRVPSGTSESSITVLKAVFLNGCWAVVKQEDRILGEVDEESPFYRLARFAERRDEIRDEITRLAVAELDKCVSRIGRRKN